MSLNPAFPLLGNTPPRNLRRARQETWTNMAREALLVTAGNWKQCKCLIEEINTLE